MAGASRASAQTGGFVETATDTSARAPLSASELQALLPVRGRFTFPAPYETTATRLTNGTDCGGGDCVNYVGYAYWRNMNNHVGSDTILIFLGLDRGKGGSGPTLFTYHKSTGETRNAGPLFDATSRFSWATGEGWYFSASRPTALYLNDGPRMLRYDVIAKTFETVFDISQHLGTNRYIWQMHSSNDDRVHSATVRDSSTYAPLGCAVYREDTATLTYMAAIGAFDECQVDKSGRWLVIKENVDGVFGEDNRIIDLANGTEQVFYDHQGAAGHSDLGYGYMVAEDDFHSLPGAVRVWRLGESITATGQGALAYHISSWNVGGVGHLAHSNAKAGVSITHQIACSSSAHRLNEPRINEIVCYRLDGSLKVLVVAPNMTNLDAAGGGDDYGKRPKGNLDVTGDYFLWTSNAGSSRLDAFIVHVPHAKLTTTDGSPTTDSSGAVTWAVLTNVTLSGTTLQKTSGCDGCPDGVAISDQQIGSTGALDWTAPERDTLRVVGLSSSATTVSPSELPFAIRLQSGYAEVRELGVYKADVTFNAGDALRIAVENGAVRYLKNGTAFYTSGTSATTAMHVHAIFYGLSGTIANVTVTMTDGSTSGGTTTEPSPVITLTATGYKVKGLQKAGLTWSGATATSVDVYRNGVIVATTPNDGAHVDNIDKTGKGSYRYRICNAGTTACSNKTTVRFK